MTWRNPYFNASLAHHTPGGFRNLEPFTHAEGDYRRWRKERRARKLPRAPAGGYEAFAQRWSQCVDFAETGDAAWWLGHACVLLRVGDLHVLTDPVFSQRASPLSFAGPRRRTPAPVSVAQLPLIDVVLISHNHYDHLDKRTVQQLARRFPQALFLVPLGLAKWLRRRGVKNVRELDWWQWVEHGGARFSCVPARHWSKRTLWDTNRSLWSGWVMQHPRLAFYFAGDTGYSANLAQVGERLGPFDLAALPIGAYAPRWFMHAQHVDPVQAVRLHRELRCRRSLPIHWGVFELADDPLDEPPALLAEALRNQHVEPAHFAPIPIGARLRL